MADLVDQHCHRVLRTELGLGTFEARPATAATASMWWARQFREALGPVLGGWVADGAWSRTDATRVAAMIASGNARRVYGLV